MSIEVRSENAPRFAHVPKEVLTADVSTGARCLWSLLATYAWHDERSWGVAVGTLADELHCSDRSVNKWTEELENAGLLRVQRRREQQLTNIYTIVYPKPAKDFQLPKDLPKPPKNVRRATEESADVEQGGEQRSDERTARTRAKADQNKLPEDFPDELLPHARSVFRALREVSEQHGAKEVTPRAVALVVMANRKKALVAEAYALASWSVDARRDIRDVVATYRQWLSRADTFAVVERLDEHGMPAGSGPRSAARGAPSGRKLSGMEQAQANHAEILELERRGMA